MGEGEHLPVATTRPETILGDTAVAVHPEDERYKKYIGKECIVPCSGGRRIRVIADEYVDREFGTGALKITPGAGRKAWTLWNAVLHGAREWMSSICPVWSRVNSRLSS